MFVCTTEISRVMSSVYWLTLLAERDRKVAPAPKCRISGSRKWKGREGSFGPIKSGLM